QQAQSAMLMPNALRVGTRGDVYEQEADQVADQVLAAPVNSSQIVQLVQQTRIPTRIQKQLLPPIPLIFQMPRFPRFTRPVEVNAVDARQETRLPWYRPSRYTGPLANFFLGDVTMTDISSMVINVMAFLGGGTMQRLNIMDHGSARTIQIGDDRLRTSSD